jgi:hypothetical protein
MSSTYATLIVLAFVVGLLALLAVIGFGIAILVQMNKIKQQQHAELTGLGIPDPTSGATTAAGTATSAEPTAVAAAAAQVAAANADSANTGEIFSNFKQVNCNSPSTVALATQAQGTDVVNVTLKIAPQIPGAHVLVQTAPVWPRKSRSANQGIKVPFMNGQAFLGTVPAHAWVTVVVPAPSTATAFTLTLSSGQVIILTTTVNVPPVIRNPAASGNWSSEAMSSFGSTSHHHRRHNHHESGSS